MEQDNPKKKDTPRPALLKKMNEYLRGESPERILDVGGTQTTFDYLKKTFPSSEIISLNIEESELPKDDKAVLANAEELPFEDNHFDMIFVKETIEHIFRPDKFINEAKRALKVGGKILVTTPNLNSWHVRLLILFGYAPTNYTPYPGRTYGIPRFFKTKPLYDHVRVFPYNALKEIFSSDGFEIEYISGVMTYSESAWLWKWRKFFGYFMPNKWREGIVLKAVLKEK
jgi:ubiquinone/menaquinone biosynthesis C-methylase UbiE